MLLRTSAPSLWSAGHLKGFCFLPQENDMFRDKGATSDCVREGHGPLKIQARPPSPSASLPLALCIWSVKALCLTLMEGSLDWERIWWSWWQNSLNFNGSTSGPWEQSPPHFAGIAALVKGEKLTTALPQIHARVLQTATTIPLLVTCVAFEEGGLEVLGLRQQRPFVVQMKYLQSDQRNFGESGS